MGEYDESENGVDGIDAGGDGKRWRGANPRMMCWDWRAVKVIGDARKYVALARLGKSFFLQKDKVPVSDVRRTTPNTLCRMHVSVCS